jgi:hypothetical protein
MSVLDAFDQFQSAVDADPDQVAEARQRQQTFVSALLLEPDIAQVVPSGSLRRSTQLEPIHDVDLIAIFDIADRNGWGEAGDSSAESLETVREIVSRRLGATSGTEAQLVRLAKPRNRAVKCFIDPPEQENAFTVDVMPAFRNADDTITVASVLDREWTVADPEWLIREVARRHAEWNSFRPLVRVLKRWRHEIPVDVKSLVMEVLAYHYLPAAPNRPEALRAFFTAAAVQVNYGVEDPAGHCGDIQPELDISALSAELSRAAEAATKAVHAQAANDPDEAQRIWQSIFGPDFPAPPKSTKAPALAPAVTIKDSPQGTR